MFKKVLSTSFILALFATATAQVDSLKMNFDFRTRAELDNGVMTLIPKEREAETIVQSRARLGINYYYQNLEMYLALQDARTWGETVSGNQRSGSLNVYEAWAKYNFNKIIAMKVGRQALSYDDERMIGALDWSMAARSFDAIKGIFKIGNSKLETVVTYNNDKIDTNNTPTNEVYALQDGGEFTKSMQIIHYDYTQNKFAFSAIAINNVVQNLVSGTHYDMATLGVNGKYYLDQFGFFGSAYWQTGKNSFAQSKNAYQFSVNVDYKINPNANLVLGTEWLSGNNDSTSANDNTAFSPLYGTNHKFNGFMDYFFVGSGKNNFNAFGLNDYYLKSKISFNPKANLQTNLHAFTTNGNLGNNQGEKLSNYLGTELDMVFTYKVASIFSFNFGHSFMFYGDSMKYIKAVNDPKSLQTWSWIGINFSPKFKIK